MLPHPETRAKEINPDPETRVNSLTLKPELKLVLEQLSMKINPSLSRKSNNS